MFKIGESYFCGYIKKVILVTDVYDSGFRGRFWLRGRWRSIPFDFTVDGSQIKNLIKLVEDVEEG